MSATSEAPDLVVQDGQPTRGRSPEWVPIVVWVVAYLAACAAFVAVRDRMLLISVLAILGVLGAALKLHAVVQATLRGRGALWRHRLSAAALLLAVAVGLLIAWRVGLGSGLGFFGVVIGLLWLGLVIEQFRRSDGAASLGRRWLLGGAVAMAVGLAALVAFGGSIATWIVLLAGVATAFGLSLVSEGLLRDLGPERQPSTTTGAPLRHRRLAPMLAVGAVLFGGGMLVLSVAVGVPAGYLLALGVAAIIVAFAVASQSNVDVVVAVAVAALVWTLAQQRVPVTDAMQADDRPEPEVVLVALGDSYMSGEGAEEFFEGTNEESGSQCRRAPTAFAPLLILDEHPSVPDHLAFLACSGASIDDVRDEQLVELTELRSATRFETSMVLLSVGGNDALFGTIGRTCLLPGDCSELGPAWRDNLLATVGDALEELYADVRSRVGDVPVLVMPYPVPIRGEGCDYSVFSNDEHQFLHDYTVELNGVVRRAAAAAQFHYVETMADALFGWRLCDGPAGQVGVNFLAANSVVGTVEQAVNPLNWFHNSLHPNARGHELLHLAMVQWLDDPEHQDLDVVPPDEAELRAPLESEILSRPDTPCVGEREQELNDCTAHWLRLEVGRFVIWPGGLVLLICAGAFCLAIPTIAMWRRYVVAPTDG